MKLEPTEAQRKAMAEATEAWNWYSCGPERRLDMVDDMIAAANSIPDGAPVGTIARRPDGAFVAVRVLAEDLEQYWTYTCVDHSGPDDDWPDRRDADSWPVIFTPGEAVGSGPTTDGGETHDPTRDQGIQEYLDWIYTQINPDEEPDCGGDLCEDCIRWRTDPTAQQEPGESLARGLDDLAAGRVSRRDDYLEPQQEPAASIDASHLERQREFSLKTFGPGARTNGVLDHIAKELNEIREAPEDISEWVDVIILAFDGAWRAGWEPQQIIDAIVAKQSKNEQREWPDWRTADPDKAIEHVRASEDTKPRTPRVVDRLGVDEQGSRWRDKVGDKWWFSSLGGWRYQSHLDGIAGTGDPVGAYAPYVELIEPRVLPSLDCEEARDGTEWKFRLNGEPRSLVYRNNGWRYGEVGDRIGGRCGVSDGHAFIREFAPYIEVVGDPS